MTDTPPNTNTETRSTSGLFAEVMNHVSGLVRKEIDLVRAEVNENAKRAMIAIAMIVGGLVVLLVALNVLAAALVDGIAALGIAAGLAALIVGVLFVVIAAIMAKKGQSDLKTTSLAPSRSAKNVQKDAHAVKESLNG